MPEDTHGFPKKDFYDPQPAPVDRKGEASIKMAEALSMQDGDVAVIILEKREVGGLQMDVDIIQKAHVRSPPNTLRTQALDLVNAFLKKRQGKP
jgi:hypothetical protein